MPVGIVPITSAVTKVVYGKQSAEVCFENGEIRPVEIDELSAYISEQENAKNELGVRKLSFTASLIFLKTESHMLIRQALALSIRTIPRLHTTT